MDRSIERVLSVHTLSPAMQRVYDVGVSAAKSGANILIIGEPGVGKEVMVHRLHRLSARAEKPLVSFNCAAVPEGRLEVELFGCEKNALVATPQAQQGVLERAHGGTVFLDEIGELPLMHLGKLAGAIETRSVYRVGSERPIPIDVRFMAATQRDLKAHIVKTTRYAEDYLRLIEVTLVIPPLRERRSEIPELAGLFVAEGCQDQGRPLLRISPTAMAVLQDLSWPGNIRALINTMHRSVILCDASEIGPDLLPTR